MIKPLPSLMLLTMTTLLLSGCADRIGLAEQAMQDIRASQAQEVEPTPKVSLVEDFVYSASSLRSPFLPPSLVNIQRPTSAIDGIRPDINRIKQPLEQYEIAQDWYYKNDQEAKSFCNEFGIDLLEPYENFEL